MSFLDNLENHLKSLEERDQSADNREHQQREAMRARALASAPWAEQLRSSPFTAELLRHATRIGHGQRTKVRMTWIGTTLRLEAADKRLELRPGADCIAAVFLEGGQEVSTRPIDLASGAETLAREWLRA